MSITTKELINLLMVESDYNIFKAFTTIGLTSRLTIIVPKKCNFFYRHKGKQVATAKTSTKAVINSFADLNGVVYNDMGFNSKLCSVDICITNIEGRFQAQKVEFYNNEKYFLFLDSVPFMSITRFYDEKYAVEVDFFENMVCVGENNIANYIVDIESITVPKADRIIDTYANVRFDTYKIVMGGIVYSQTIDYTVPYSLLTEDYNYNKATLERLYNKIYEEFLD